MTERKAEWKERDKEWRVDLGWNDKVARWRSDRVRSVTEWKQGIVLE